MKAKKEELVSAGIELFKNEGFEKVTVDQICQECGVTKGSFYHHFHSKNELLLSYYNFLLSRPIVMMTDVMKEEQAKEQLWKAIEYSIDATVALGPDLLFHMLVADMYQGSRLLSPYYDEENEDTEEYVKLILILIQKCQQKGEVHRETPPKELWFAYVSGLIGIAVNWSSAKGEYDQKKELRRLFDIIFHM